MTVNKMQRIWPYLLLAAVWLVLFPIITGVIIAALASVFKPADNPNLDFNYAYIVWGYTLFYGTWSFLLFALLPYTLLYVYTSLNQKNIFLKLLILYVLLTLMGFVAQDGSVIDFFGSSPYPRVWILYFLLTIMLCPLCNIALNRMVKNRVANPSKEETT